MPNRVRLRQRALPPTVAPPRGGTMTNAGTLEWPPSPDGIGAWTGTGSSKFAPDRCLVERCRTENHFGVRTVLSTWMPKTSSARPLNLRAHRGEWVLGVRCDARVVGRRTSTNWMAPHFSKAERGVQPEQVTDPRKERLLTGRAAAHQQVRHKVGYGNP